MFHKFEIYIDVPLTLRVTRQKYAVLRKHTDFSDSESFLFFTEQDSESFIFEKKLEFLKHISRLLLC